jgi:hypothetical protein
MKGKLLLTGCFCSVLLSISAQTLSGNYTFAQSNASYSTISGGTVLWNSASSSMNDVVSSAITIPNFNFNGTTYTSLYVSTNGFITFGTAPATNNYTAISNAASYAGAVSAFGGNLDKASTGTPEIRYAKSGSEFVIQFQDMRRSAVASERISFQIRLDTSSYVIKIVFGGTITPGSNTTYLQVGLRAAANTNYLNRAVISSTGAWVNSTNGAANTNTCYFNSATSGTVPAAGCTFSYTPTAMTYTSCTAIQPNTSSVSVCGVYQQVIGFTVTTSGGSINPISLTSVSLNMTGCTSIADVSRIHIFYSGLSATMLPANDFVSTGFAPASGTITVSGTQALQVGLNYFWITYDMVNTASIGNVIDAQCTALTVAGVGRTPSTTNPAGTRTISACVPYPGGIDGRIKTWFKPNSSHLTQSGGKVSAWQDEFSTITVSQATGSRQPSYVAGSTNPKRFNYNPRLSFNPTNLTNLTNTATTPDILGTNGTFILTTDQDPVGITAFAYYSNTNYRYQNKPNFRVQTGVSGLGTTYDFGSPTEYSVNSASIQTSIGTGTNMSFRGNSSSNNNPNNSGIALYSPTINAGLEIGSNTWLAEYTSSSMADIITFDTMISSLQLDQAESYIAIKYGIQRGGNTAPQNYYSSNGNTVWNATTNSAYSKDIAGIGRDDASALTQKQSISVNNNELLTIGLGNIAADNISNSNSFTNDRSFLMWGNNGQSSLAGYSLTDNPSGIQARLQRVWKVQLTNFNQNTTVGFDTSYLVNFMPVSNLRLIVDDDGVFNNATVISGAVLNNGRVEFSGVNFNTLAKPYLTLATISIPNTPLPVSLLNFTSTCSVEHELLNWETATEVNNDYFEVEGSSDGQTFYSLAKLKGAGNSAEAHRYQWMNDKMPAQYYRLNQVDFDGKQQLSEIITTTCTTNEAAISELVVYPNPFDRDLHVAQSENWPKATMLQLISAQGDIVFRKEVDSEQALIDITWNKNLAAGIYLLLGWNDKQQIWRRNLVKLSD